MNTLTQAQITATNEALRLKITQLEDEVRALRTRADRDDLTGCLRREAFLSMIKERRRFGWLSQDMTLAVVDIDHFKKVNDTYGHLTGDEALKQLARFLNDHVPEGSLVCRMGGEEFVVLLPGNAADTVASLESLRTGIERMNVRTLDDGVIKITASFGSANWNSDEDLLIATARADAALYAAKKGGRNRVVVSGQNADDFRMAS